MTADVIVIDRLVKTYGGTPALTGVSLKIKRGEFVALLGPSGCGKTTLLRSIAGFVEPTSGTITINGRAMNGVPAHQRPVNTVFQQYALFPHLTVAENIAFGPRRKRVAADEIRAGVDNALAMVRLEGLQARYPRELSGGQQQRVALARALINKPDVLLLDEPLGALDLKLRKRMQVELKGLQRQLGTTFLFVTHDQEEALSMADRIAVMRNGEIVQLGSGAEVYRNPATRYVADFIGEANLLMCKAGEGGQLTLLSGKSVLPYANPSASGEVVVMIRPEDVTVGTASPQPDDVVLLAEVKDKVFLGASFRVYLTLEDGQEIATQPGSTVAAEQLMPGAKTQVRWRRDAARVLTS